MELCPKCNRMTAERNHYTEELICYNRFCGIETVKEVKSHRKKKKKIFFISPVRVATPEIIEDCEKYVKKLEKEGNEVFWPRRDNPHQETDLVGINICDMNFEKIFEYPEIHVWYLKESSGSHLDFGGVYMLLRILKYEKKIVFANKNEFAETIKKPEKNFPKVLDFLERTTK